MIDTPFVWTNSKLRNMLDRYISLKPTAKQIPIYAADYDALVRMIPVSRRAEHQDNLWYKGKHIVKHTRNGSKK